MINLILSMYIMLCTNEIRTSLRYFKIQLYYKKQYSGTGAVSQ